MLKRPILLFTSLLIIFNLSLLFASQNVQKVNADVGGLVGLINQYRIANGLGSLTEDQSLTNAACWLTADMATNNYFDHTDSLERDMASRLTAFGVTGGTRGENIASLMNQANSAQKIFDGWKDSPGHRANMLNPSFTRIGVGNAYRAANVTYYWVADFASGTASGSVNGCSTVNNPPPTPPAPKPSSPKSSPLPPQLNPVPNPEPTLTATSTPTTTISLLQKNTTKTTLPKEKSASPQKNNGNETLILAGLVIVNLFLVVPILLVALL